MKDLYIEDIPKGVSIVDYITALERGHRLVNRPKEEKVNTVKQFNDILDGSTIFHNISKEGEKMTDGELDNDCVDRRDRVDSINWYYRQLPQDQVKYTYTESGQLLSNK